MNLRRLAKPVAAAILAVFVAAGVSAPLGAPSADTGWGITKKINTTDTGWG